MDQETRPCFRRCFVSGTTRKHANEAATALQRPRSAPADFYLQATPRLGFSNTRETCSLAPEEPLPAATVLPSLAGDLHPADHVPRGRYPSGLLTVCPGLPPGHSFHRNDFGDFSRSNTEASSYPSVKGFRNSAPSSAGFTGKPFFSGLSWLSYSWSPDLPEIPECGLTPGPACRQAENSPRQPS